MMTKADHIAYWVDTADKNWRALHRMAQAGDNLEALFWAHFCLEKLSKAIWVKENVGNTPPRIHNILSLLRDTSVVLSPQHTATAFQLNNFQLEGRYPDHQQRMYRVATNAYTAIFLQEVTSLRQCLLANLP